MCSRGVIVWPAAGVVLAAALPVPAGASVVFTGSGGDRSASAEFSLSGSRLVVCVTNTSRADVVDSSGVLTAVFFDIDGRFMSLSRVAAAVESGQGVMFGGTERAGRVGGEWAYRGQRTGMAAGERYGISSTGFGIFGTRYRFPGRDLQGGRAIDGIQYGITSAGDDPTTGDAAVTGENALIQSSVEFRLGGVGRRFDLGRIRAVVFQYGTVMDGETGFLGSPTPTPTPGTLALLTAAGLTALVRRRR